MKIGIIGGSGLEKENILSNVQEILIETPYGIPSPIKKGCLTEMKSSSSRVMDTIMK